VDGKYVDPFIESFETVMPQLGFSNMQKGNLSEKGQELVSSGVIIIVGIVGAIKGNVVYCIDMEKAKQLASTMMMGMPVEEFDEMAQSALSELTNMLTASAATCFYNLGIQIDISTPTLLHGKNISVKMSSKQVLCIEMLADDNPIEINIAIE
jgi:chemotaxis protein CheX